MNKQTQRGFWVVLVLAGLFATASAVLADTGYWGDYGWIETKGAKGRQYRGITVYRRPTGHWGDYGFIETGKPGQGGFEIQGKNDGYWGDYGYILYGSKQAKRDRRFAPKKAKIRPRAVTGVRRVRKVALKSAQVTKSKVVRGE